MIKENILTVVAHPDDEILGCGGTIAKLSKRYNCYLLVLGEGITSRDKWKQKDLDNLKENVYSANKILGVKPENIYIESYSDNKFDSVPLLDIVKTVSKYIKRCNTNIVFTHTKNCLNIDHRRTYEAVLTSTRPMEDNQVKTILSMEIMSSTEWYYPLGFSPNVFYDISETIDIKMKSMMEYKDELRSFPHPRSLLNICQTAQNWGCKTGKHYVEAFELVRSIEG